MSAGILFVINSSAFSAAFTLTSLFADPVKFAGVSVNPANDVVVETPVSCEPSIAGSLPVPSSCTILPADVPTSTAIVPEAVIVPPVKPVPAVILVTVPEPAFDGFQ